MARNLRASLHSPTSKVLGVLGAVARLQQASISAIAEDLGLTLPTTHRICAEIERVGLLQRVPGTRLWTVALPMVDIACNALAAAAGSATAHAILRRLTHDTGEMCSIGVEVGDEVVYIASAEPPNELTLFFRAGRRAPLYCTSSGRLFLSRLDDAAVRDYLAAAPLAAHTRYTIQDPQRLAAEIARIRMRGFAMTNQEYVLHIVGAAVPISGANGTFYGALSIAAPLVRMDAARLRRTMPALQDAAAQLARCWARQIGKGRASAPPREKGRNALRYR
ncbi:MAG TPA: IclR family transcriptional regulator [Hyphomicrobiaceae bacterium]|nr:IclR family transcriptional regulator [Hyphomicrobiaceae bacterium]